MCRLYSSLDLWCLPPVGAWANRLIPLHTSDLFYKMEMIASNHRLVALMTLRSAAQCVVPGRCSVDVGYAFIMGN